ARAPPAAPGGPRTPFEAVLAHREADGSPLDPRTAAVELLNIVRPTVAISWFATFAAHAMSGSPAVRDRLADGDPGFATSFAHEVRRFYPFVPFVGALAPDGLVVAGDRVPRGTMLLLDVYGQNHDPALWDEPLRFVPDRFLGRPPHRDTLIPQGGGPREGHRCPGEDITVAVLSGLARELARLDFTVPPQDLRIPLTRVPTRPRSGFRLVVGAGARAGAGAPLRTREAHR
ncbi:cytochrome P450, partial [Streptomyces sp. NPDC003327]